MKYVLAVVACLLAVGQSPEPVRHVTIRINFIPPILVLPESGDVDGDGKVTQADLDALQEYTPELERDFLRPFYEELSVPVKDWYAEFERDWGGTAKWLPFEQRKEGVHFLAQVMVRHFLRDPDAPAVMLISWDGETTVGGGPVSKELLEEALAGKATYRQDEATHHWLYVQTTKARILKRGQ